MMLKKFMSGFLVTAVIAACVLTLTPKTSHAAVYDDPVRFYREYASDGQGMYKDGYVYFGSRGRTATSGIKFKTVGYRIYLGDSSKPGFDKEKRPQFEVVLNGGWVSEYKEKADSDGYTYVVRRAKASKLKTLFATNVDGITYNQLYRSPDEDITHWNFDAIMTVVKNGTDLCGKVTQDYEKGVITAEHNGHMYRYFEDSGLGKGIADAENWSPEAKDSLKTFFNQWVEVKPYTELECDAPAVSSTDNNMYFTDNKCFVRKSTQERTSDFILSLKSYMKIESIVEGKYEPNFNMANVTPDRQIYSGAKRAAGNLVSGSSGYPFAKAGISSYATASAASGLSYFNTELTLRNNMNDGERADISASAAAYYGRNNYPAALEKNGKIPNTEYLVDSAVAEKPVTVISDGRAPQIDVPAVTLIVNSSVMTGIPLLVNDGDGASGIDTIEIYRIKNGTDTKETLRTYTFTEYTTQMVSRDYTGNAADNMLGATDRSREVSVLGQTGYTYYVSATDNVGNVSVSPFVFKAPTNYTIETGLSNGVQAGSILYNPKNMYIAVSGGTGEIRNLTAYSDEDENPAKERIVLVNKSIDNGGISHGLYSYSHLLNPMNFIKGKPDGAYNFNVVSGGAFSAASKYVTIHKDETSPVVTGHGPFTGDEDSWTNVKPDSPSTGINYNNYINAEDAASGVRDLKIYSTDNAAGNGKGHEQQAVKENSISNSHGTTGILRKYLSFEKMTEGYEDGRSAMDEGRHTFNAEAEDFCGNRGSTKLYANFDYTAPQITLPEGMQQSGSNTYYVSTPVLNWYYFTVSDYLSGLETDGSSIKIYSGSGTGGNTVNSGYSIISKEYSHATELRFSIYQYLPEGQHTFTIQVTDRAGNATQKIMTFIVDQTAPTLYMDGAGKVVGTAGRELFKNDFIEYQMINGTKTQVNTKGTEISWEDKKNDYWYSQSSWYGRFMVFDPSSANLKYAYVKSIDTGKKKDLITNTYSGTANGTQWFGLYYPQSGRYCYENYDMTEITGKDEGAHECVLYAEDYAGNKAEYTFYVKLDRTGPDIAYVPDSSKSVNGWNISFPGKIKINDNLSGIKNYKIYAVDMMGNTSLKINGVCGRGTTDKTYDLGTPYENYKDVYVVSEDYAGNVSEYHMPRNVDVQPPVLKIVPHNEVMVKYAGTDGTGKTQAANASSIDFVFEDGTSGLAYCEVKVWWSDGKNKELYVSEASKSLGDGSNSTGVPIAEPGTETVISIDTSKWDDVFYVLSVRAIDCAGNTVSGTKTEVFARTRPKAAYTLNNTTGEGRWNPESVTVNVESAFLGLQKMSIAKDWNTGFSYSHNYNPVEFSATDAMMHLTSPSKRGHTAIIDTKDATEDKHTLKTFAYDYANVANILMEDYELSIDHTPPATINGGADVSYHKNDDGRYIFNVENCTDNRSGVKSAYVYIHDTDSGSSDKAAMTVDIDDMGTAYLESGEITLPYESPNWEFEIHATDNAGNDGILETVPISAFSDGFTLTASIRRRWKPTAEKYKTAFNRGELGYVDFTVTGKPERITFEFPENLNVPNNIDDDSVRMNGGYTFEQPYDVYDSAAAGKSYEFRVPRYLNDIYPGHDDSAHYSYISDNLQEQDTPRKTYTCKVTAYRTVNGVEESAAAYCTFSIRKYVVDDYLVAVPVHPWYIKTFNIHSLDDILDRWERKWPDECGDFKRYDGSDDFNRCEGSDD